MNYDRRIIASFSPSVIQFCIVTHRVFFFWELWSQRGLSSSSSKLMNNNASPEKKCSFPSYNTPHFLLSHARHMWASLVRSPVRMSLIIHHGDRIIHTQIPLEQIFINCFLPQYLLIWSGRARVFDEFVIWYVNIKRYKVDNRVRDSSSTCALALFLSNFHNEAVIKIQYRRWWWWKREAWWERHVIKKWSVRWALNQTEIVRCRSCPLTRFDSL